MNLLSLFVPRGLDRKGIVSLLRASDRHVPDNFETMPDDRALLHFSIICHHELVCLYERIGYVAQQAYGIRTAYVATHPPYHEYGDRVCHSLRQTLRLMHGIPEGYDPGKIRRFRRAVDWTRLCAYQIGRRRYSRHLLESLLTADATLRGLEHG